MSRFLYLIFFQIMCAAALLSSCETIQTTVNLPKAEIYQNYIFPSSVDGFVLTLKDRSSNEEMNLGYVKISDTQWEVTTYEKTKNGIVPTSESCISFVDGVEKLEKYTYKHFGTKFEVIGEASLSMNYTYISENSYEFNAKMEMSGGGFSDYATRASRSFTLSKEGLVEELFISETLGSQKSDSKFRKNYLRGKGLSEVYRYNKITGNWVRFVLERKMALDNFLNP